MTPKLNRANSLPKTLALFAALACGALLPLTLAPFDWWPVGLVSIGGWFWLLNRSTAPAWALGFAYGLGKFGIGVSWVYVSIHTYGNAPPPLATLLVLVFVAGLSLFTLAHARLYDWLRIERQSGRPAGAAALFNPWLFAAGWVAFEWLLTWFLTGFPWLYPGYGHLETPLAHLLPVGGVSLASLGIVVTASFLTLALFERHRPGVRAAAAAIAAVPWLIGLTLSVSGVQWVEPVATRSAALVQGNVDQAVKWNRENRMPIVNRYLDLTEPHWGRDLILWPEAAITLFEHEAAPLLQRLGERGEQSGTSLVLGLPRVEAGSDGDHRFQNAAIAVGAGDGRYVKRRLAPFGDYVPFEGILRGLIEFFDLPMSRAAPGAWEQQPLTVGDDLAAMAICYEIAYANLTRTTAADAGLILTITNDTWFGRSIGPLQHLQIAQARALENGRWLLRAASNGVTAFVDHRGRVRARLPQFEPGVLAGTFEIMAGRTPYSRFGDGWLVAACLGSLLLFAWRARKKRARRKRWRDS